MHSLPPNATPVTPACIVRAAAMERVPLAAVVAIMRTEQGRVGAKQANSNGTYDYGPMQVNTIWLPRIHRAGITTKQLQNNGCLNVLVGSWILKQEMVAAPESIWRAIGHYHSHTRYLAVRYRKNVLSKMISLRSVSEVVEHANDR